MKIKIPVNLDILKRWEWVDGLFNSKVNQKIAISIHNCSEHIDSTLFDIAINDINLVDSSYIILDIDASKIHAINQLYDRYFLYDMRSEFYVTYENIFFKLVPYYRLELHYIKYGG